ncbi:precorrin-2 C(20)-methyltransferase [Yinghuangia seranimata]|uniref:precorrin-2 C(20)-methyltransferase n=1 Tax=Yinghuangia seranimata TaxID=408067 RepID=UPI00248BB1FC|nr:precorrin-2 C(20)-methyltransferase [Yinghuangia seranimata]MDI2125768.1 precorrin-2 C(20)-methyltransferase [Yinghuangia seranimata]
MTTDPAVPSAAEPQGAPAATGRLYGVGLGPGDPELMTLKAHRLITSAQVVAYPVKKGAPGVAITIAGRYLSDDQIRLPMEYPVTTGTTDHPGGYDGALADFYDETAAEIAAHLDAGRDVAVLCEGDPFFYGSYMYWHERLADRYPAEVVPGVTSVSGASAMLGRPLVQHDEVLTILPGTLPPDVLAARLRTADSAAVIKLGRRHFEDVRAAFEDAGTDGRTWYVERATTARQRIAPLTEVDAADVPYFSLVVTPSAAPGTPFATNRTPAVVEPDYAVPEPTGEPGSVDVVGLGPAGPTWLTPEAHAVLAAADHLVGYGPYVARVQPRPGQKRHMTDNRVEAERARHALALAEAGARVAVVSSGDAGVFAMASAVLEAADETKSPVPVRVVPGLSAMQAVAARAGAPLGHDFCVISLSDVLKPWDVIARRLTAAAQADLAVAIYNPASKTRRHQIADARDLFLAHRDPATPVVVARDVGGPTEAVRVVALGELDPEIVDMRTLLIVGSSTTRTYPRPDGTVGVYTPRRYPA